MAQPGWWSARVTLFTINRLDLTSAVCVCIIFTVSASQHPDLTVFPAFVVPTAESSGFFVLSVPGRMTESNKWVSFTFLRVDGFCE